MELINGHQVEFDEINHIYYVDGKEVPSVSQICKLDNPSMYQGIDKQVLNMAAQKGVNLHKIIENYEQHGIIQKGSIELQNYIQIKKKYQINQKHSERMVLIELDGKVVCAGRFDLLGDIGGIPALIDFKRTSELHSKYVKLQLNLYALGLLQSYGEIVEKLMVIRLRYFEVEILEFELDFDFTIETLRKYI